MLRYLIKPPVAGLSTQSVSGASQDMTFSFAGAAHASSSSSSSPPMLLVLLCLWLSLCSARRHSYFVSNIKFSRPCENNTYDELTGNFKCTVPTGAECFKLCQQYGCYEWSFSSFMASTDNQERDHFRCRCIQEICLYNYVRPRDRDYE